MTHHNMTKALFLGLILATATLIQGAGARPESGPLDRNEIKRLVVEEAEGTSVPPALALALAKVESDFQGRALSDKGARGVMQIMPSTARGEFGIGADELWDPRLNIQLGLSFLEQLHRRYGGRWDLALSHYNGGSLRGSGARAKAHGFNRHYVQSVLDWQHRYAEQAVPWRDPSRGTEPGNTVVGWTPARTVPSRALANTDPNPVAVAKEEAPADWRQRPPRTRVGTDNSDRFDLDDFTPRWRGQTLVHRRHGRRG
ncbi:MAG: lytic transglycosylase domain-containing protein [Proteobacteria bacterium]|nr:lytic transglycosylase domain-containing protein [Pseudomonadota bacterium]